MYVLFLVFHNNAAASSYLASAQSDWALTQRVCQTQWNPHKIFSVWPGVNGNHQKSRMSTTTHSTQQRTSVFFCPLLLLLLCCSAAFSVFSGVFANRTAYYTQISLKAFQCLHVGPFIHVSVNDCFGLMIFLMICSFFDFWYFTWTWCERSTTLSSSSSSTSHPPNVNDECRAPAA